MYDVLVVGGGAAGFYGAIHCGRRNPSLRVGILERGGEVLSKVKISGGGRCNVTHAEFDPRQLTSNYPRGEKELLGPFHHYACGDTISFFEDCGVPLKIESDGRVFPVSDSSQTIIDSLLQEAKALEVEVIRREPVLEFTYHKESAHWQVITRNQTYRTAKLLLATGSNPKVWHVLQRLGHTVVPPVPSLFTFTVQDERLEGLQGISTPAQISILGKKRAKTGVSLALRSDFETQVHLEAEGPLLITHTGISGPAVLRLSAWGARHLNECNYQFQIRINWLPDYHQGGVLDLLREIKEVEGRKTILRTHAFPLPRRLWSRLVLASGISRSLKWAELSKAGLQELARQLVASEFAVRGKSTFKEEFVTAGGVDLSEIDLRTFESKLLPDLYFAGEIMNVDAITGGFNFQNAWTSAYLAAQALSGQTQPPPSIK